jgi:hypothetical protein
MIPGGGSPAGADNIEPLHRPPYSPELNPVENVWEFLRPNDLSNCVYATCEAIADACYCLEQALRPADTYPIHRHSSGAGSGSDVSTPPYIARR